MKQIFYLSSLISKNKFEELFPVLNKYSPGIQAQKFNGLICKGLSMNGVVVTAICNMPVNRRNSSKVILKPEREVQDKIEYVNPLVVNVPGIKDICSLLGIIHSVIKYRKSKDAMIICDVLSLSSSMAACFIRRILGLKIVGVVTDLPCFMFEKSNLMVQKCSEVMLHSYDAYIFLTEEMNELINKKNVPYLVIEGIIDSGFQAERISSYKSGKRICLYAGGIERKYGVENLVLAFAQLKNENCELHLYGTGDYVDILQQECKVHGNIKYKGMKPNEYIVKKEMEAELLINPRFVEQEFVKYSFPSKNMEYMLSGTPVLTTKLPGMPKEYYPYVYLFQGTTVEDMRKDLENILSMPQEKLCDKGRKARNFVLEWKSEVIQGKRILNELCKMEKKQ